jgi:hypothetical protein
MKAERGSGGVENQRRVEGILAAPQCTTQPPEVPEEDLKISLSNQSSTR